MSASIYADVMMPIFYTLSLTYPFTYLPIPQIQEVESQNPVLMRKLVQW